MGIFGAAEATANLFPDCYTLSEVPGRQIVESLGLIEYTEKSIAGDMPDTITGIFHGLLDEALERGGNAVVNVRLMTGSYQQQGTQWQVTYVVAYGDAVVLAPLDTKRKNMPREGKRNVERMQQAATAQGDGWHKAALAAGVRRELADIGRTVLSKRFQNNWEGFEDELSEAEMLLLAQNDPEDAAFRWQYLIETDGERLCYDEDGRLVNA